MKFSFTPASQEMLPELLGLCRRAAQAPGSHWDDQYPSLEILQSDLRQQALYRIDTPEEAPMGLISMGRIGEQNDLPWPDEEALACEMSRFGLDPAYQGQGLGGVIFLAAARHCFAQGFGSIRFLVCTQDQRLRRLYARCGAQHIGHQCLYGLDFEQYLLTPQSL